MNSTAAINQTLPRSTKFLYGVLVVVAALALITFLLVRLINASTTGSGTGSTPAKQQYTNDANPGSTRSTGAPTRETNTPTDRTVPSTSGGGANTILNPSVPGPGQ